MIKISEYKGTLVLETELNKEIRAVLDDELGVLFVANDITKCLGYKAPHKIAPRRAKDECVKKRVQFVAYTGRTGSADTNCLTEAGVCELLEELRAPDSFMKWVVEDLFTSVEKYIEKKKRDERKIKKENVVLRRALVESNKKNIEKEITEVLDKLNGLFKELLAEIN